MIHFSWRFLFEMFFAPMNIIGGMFEIQSETRVGLYVKYSLLTKGITSRLQILVEHTSIILIVFVSHRGS